MFDDAFSQLEGLNVSPYNASPLPIASQSWGLGQAPDWSFDQSSTLAGIKTQIASPGSQGVSAASSGPVAAGGGAAGSSSSASPSTLSAPPDCAWYDLNCRAKSMLPDTSSWQSTIETYFVRAAVIILGLICIAVGLSMFKPVQQIATTAAKVAA